MFKKIEEVIERAVVIGVVLSILAVLASLLDHLVGTRVKLIWEIALYVVFITLVLAFIGFVSSLIASCLSRDK